MTLDRLAKQGIHALKYLVPQVRRRGFPKMREKRLMLILRSGKTGNQNSREVDYTGQYIIGSRVNKIFRLPLR